MAVYQFSKDSLKIPKIVFQNCHISPLSTCPFKYSLWGKGIKCVLIINMSINYNNVNHLRKWVCVFAVNIIQRLRLDMPYADDWRVKSFCRLFCLDMATCWEIVTPSRLRSRALRPYMALYGLIWPWPSILRWPTQLQQLGVTAEHLDTCAPEESSLCSSPIKFPQKFLTIASHSDVRNAGSWK